MKIEYYPDTDTLYMSLREGPGADAMEIASGVVIDVDAQGRLVGIEFDPATSVTNPTVLETNLKVHALELKPTA